MRKEFAQRVLFVKTYQGLIQLGSQIAGRWFPKLATNQKDELGKEILRDYLASESHTAHGARIQFIVVQEMEAQQRLHMVRMEMIKAQDELKEAAFRKAAVR
jgi:hypothetical protein